MASPLVSPNEARHGSGSGGAGASSSSNHAAASLGLGHASTPPALAPRRPSASARLYSSRLRAGAAGGSGADEALVRSLEEAPSLAHWLNGALAAQAAARSEPPSNGADAGSSGDGAAAASSSSSALPSLAALDEHLSRLTISMGEARAGATAAIDDVLSHTSSSLPRLGTQLRLVRDGAVQLSERIDAVRHAAGLQSHQTGDAAPSPQANGTHADEQQVASAAAAQPAGAAEALSRLAALYTLRARMSAARDVLRLAESWSTLAPDVTSHLSEEKHTAAAARLAEAAASLPVFERTPEYDSRARLLASLTDALETQLRPQLLRAAETKDVQTAARGADVLRTVGRADEFAALWRRTRSAAAVQGWNESAAAQSAAARLQNAWPSLVEQLAEVLEEECTFAPVLFAQDPRGALEALLVGALQELEPPLALTIRSAADSSGEAALDVLLRAYGLAGTAGSRWSAILARLAAAAPSAADSPSASAAQLSPQVAMQVSPLPISPGNASAAGVLENPAASPSRPMSHARRNSSISVSRRTSRRLSVLGSLDTRRTSLEPVDGASPGGPGASPAAQAPPLGASLRRPATWESTLWTPFLEHQSMYGPLESRALQAAWQRGAAARRSAHPEGAATAAGFASELDAAIWLCSEATKRTSRFTFGLGLPSLVAAHDELLGQLLEAARSALEQTARTAMEAARARAAALLEADEETYGYGEGEEWAAFEQGVAMLRAARSAQSKLDTLEEETAAASAHIAAAVLGAGTKAGEEALGRVLEHSEKGSEAALAILLANTDVEAPALRSACEAVRSHLASRTSRAALASGSGGETRKASSNGLGSAISLPSARSSSQVIASALLPRARSALRAHVRALQRAQCDVVLAPLLPALEAYSALPAWQASRLPGATNEYDLAMPTFSVSHSRTMGRVGEGLLDLPRLLEVWAADEALGWALEALPHALDDEAAFAAAAQDAAQLDSPPRSEVALGAKGSKPPLSPTTERRTHRASASIAAIATSAPAPGAPAPHAASSHAAAASAVPEQVTPAVVLQAYLRALALSLLAHITDVVLPSIASLSAAGAAQLAADLDYLDNILASLNVDSQARGLRDWRDAAALPDAEGRALSRARSADDPEKRRLAQSGAFDAVSQMRGWS